MRLTPISLMWFWHGLKGHSVTFAALFGSLLLGASISKGVHHLLSALGFHWLYVLILPVVLFRWMASRESQWIPDSQKRRRIALSMLLGSIALSALIARLRPDPKEPVPSQPVRALQHGH